MEYIIFLALAFIEFLFMILVTKELDHIKEYVSIQYSSFEFASTEDKPNGLNILIKILVPPIYIILISGILYEINQEWLVKNIYLVTIFYYLMKWLNIIFILKRKDLHDWKSDIILSIIGTVLSIAIYYIFIIKTVEEWHGGKVHKIRDSVIHLMRGEIFDIDNKKFFTFGGAKSHDIQDGILNLDEEEKIYTFRKRGAFFRIRDYSWWDLELPTEEEMQNGINNLEKVNYKIDYIVTHCCPTSVQAILSGELYKKDYLTDYLQKISEKCEFNKWYFGHYHDNRKINSQFVLIYEDIVPLEYESIF